MPSGCDGTQPFIAIVSNATNQAISVSATAGMISPSELFTAPNVFLTSPVAITATSAADSTKTASLTLQIGSAQGANSMLFGHATIENAVNGLPARLAQGYQITGRNRPLVRSASTLTLQPQPRKSLSDHTAITTVIPVHCSPAAVP
jgi:hypothetical protein